MLELGDATEQSHREVIECARRDLPSTSGCQVALCLVGPRLAKAFAETRQAGADKSFPDAETAAEHINRVAGEGDLIYLKGSHGIALDKVETAWERKGGASG